MRSFIRRTAAAALAVSMAALPAVNVYADDTMTFEEALQASYDTVPDTDNIQGWLQGPRVYGNSAIVMDMDSGAVLYAKKPDERHYPASITKLLTALVALENSKTDDEVYFSEDSVSFLEPGDASIGMTPGEILSMNDALCGECGETDGRRLQYIYPGDERPGSRAGLHWLALDECKWAP